MGFREDIEELANEPGGSTTAGAAQLKVELRKILNRYPTDPPTTTARPPHPDTMIGRGAR